MPHETGFCMLPVIWMSVGSRPRLLVRAVIDVDRVASELAFPLAELQARVPDRVVLDVDPRCAAPQRNRVLDVAGLEDIRRDRDIAHLALARRIAAVHESIASADDPGAAQLPARAGRSRSCCVK